MSHNDYLVALKKIETDAEFAKRSLMREYAMLNNPYRSGDVVTDHVGSIRIDIIRYHLIESNPCAVYSGVILNNDGTPNKKGKTRGVYQTNIKKK
jgi:hypothetical protein